jgi:subtilisin family serine protease
MYGAFLTPGNAFGSGAAYAWQNGKTDCGSVYVGIIDEGVMRSHPDLAPNMAVNPGEILGNGVDDDGNGLIDDVYGWDFANNDNNTFDGAGDDHGTHVAGTIGAANGAGTAAAPGGVVGVCWKVKMINAKFLGSRGGTTANAIKAVDYFTDLKIRHNLNLVATNNSWGGGGYSTPLKDAIDDAGDAGILFVAAAGNSGVNNDTTPHYPSSYVSSNIISVASITSTGGLSSFSNYGARSVHIGAPGSAIWSTVPVKSGKSAVPGYASYSGTSMATPHVTGVVALYRAYNPNATAAQIKQTILNTAVPTNSLTGKTTTGGRLNAAGL